MAASLSYYARRLTSEVWQRARPSFHMRAGRRRLSIPGHSADAARLIRAWSPTWKSDLFRRCLDVRPGAFVDVGTNIGQTLIDFLLIRHADERYVGFEPNPNCAQMVSAIIEDNHITDATVAAVGLSDQNGLLELFVGQGDLTDKGGTLLRDIRPSKEVQSLRVACYRFDDAVTDMGIDAIGLIKIDVEGAEMEVLEGMTGTLEQDRPPILCEVLHRNAAADRADYVARNHRLEQFIADRRYCIRRIVRSADESHVEALIETYGFPDKVWTNESLAECDYLLLPVEDEVRYRVAA